MLRRDAGPFILHGQENRAVPARGSQPNRRARRGVNDCVLDEYPTDLQRTFLVSERRRLWAAAVDAKIVAARTGDRAEFVDERLGEHRHVDGITLYAEAAGIEAGEVEQIRRELRQPLDLLAHGRHELRLRLRIELLVRHQLEEAAEREERRPQLVGSVGDELPARVLELSQALPHALERRRELAELVSSGIGYGLAEVAARDPVRRPLEPADPPGKDRGCDVSDEEREGQRDQTGDNQPAADQVDAAQRVVE